MTIISKEEDAVCCVAFETCQLLINTEQGSENSSTTRTESECVSVMNVLYFTTKNTKSCEPFNQNQT